MDDRALPMWVLAVGIAAGLVLVGLASRLGGLAGSALVVALLGLLGLAGSQWGYDSRDGADWKPKPIE